MPIVLRLLVQRRRTTDSLKRVLVQKSAVRVVVIARGNVPDNVADPTIESLHTKMVIDPTLGGLALDVRPSSTSFEFLEADQPAGVIMCEYEVDYRSAYNNLSS